MLKINKKWNRILICLLMLVIASMFLVGCSNKNNSINSQDKEKVKQYLEESASYSTDVSSAIGNLSIILKNRQDTKIWKESFNEASKNLIREAGKIESIIPPEISELKELHELQVSEAKIIVGYTISMKNGVNLNNSSYFNEGTKDLKLINNMEDKITKKIKEIAEKYLK